MKIFILLFLTIFCLFSQPSYANKVSDRFCIFPIKNSTPTSEDVGSTWRMVDRIEVLPTIPFPIIYPLNRDGIWTLSTGNEFTFLNKEHGDLIPSNRGGDKYVYDSDKKQLFAIERIHDIGVFRYSHDHKKFEKISSDYQQSVGTIRDILYVPELNKTLVAAANGLFYIQDDKLLPFLEENKNIKNVSSIHNLPSLKAIFLIMLSSKDYRGTHETFFLTYDKKLHPIKIELDKSKFRDDYLVEAYETSPVRKIVITGGSYDYIINTTTDNSGMVIPDKIEEIQARYHVAREPVTVKFQISWDKASNRFSLFNTADTPFTTSGLQRFYEIPSRNTWITHLSDNLYIYKDGKFIKQDNPTDALAKVDLLKVYDFTSLKRVFILMENSLYELTDTNQLVPLSSAKDTPLVVRTIVEMPASKAAVALTDSGVYVIEKKGGLKLIGNDKTIPIRTISEEEAKLLNTGQVFFVGTDQLYLIGDNNVSASACR